MTVRESFKSKKPLLGQDNNSLVLLIAINAIIFVLLNFLLIVYFLTYSDAVTARNFFDKQILNWFVLPASTESFFSKPWTLITYMFTHYNVWSLLSNMLWLWAFGYILQDLTGNQKLFPIYLYGGAAGAIVFLASVNLIPAWYNNIVNISAFNGSGAAVMAVAVAATALAPDYRIFPFISGGISLWVITLIFAVIDYATIASSNGGYALAHLAGGAMGFIFIHQLKRGKDWSIWMNNVVQWMNNLFNPEQKTQSGKDNLFYKTETPPFHKTTHLTQKKLDEILDKINQQGFHMLTKEEKEFLTKASKEEL